MDDANTMTPAENWNKIKEIAEALQMQCDDLNDMLREFGHSL